MLSELAESKATGALKAGRSGTVFLSKGRVCYVECARTPSVEELLTASGRITSHGVKTARQTTAATADGGEMLVRRGVLSRGELQLCVLGATLDASFFLFGANVPKPRFREGTGTGWGSTGSSTCRACSGNVTAGGPGWTAPGHRPNSTATRWSRCGASAPSR